MNNYIIPQPPAHGHRGLGHGPKWIKSIEGPMGRQDMAVHVHALADALPDGAVRINNLTVDVPENVNFVLRFEQMPNGHFALMLRAEWAGPSNDFVPSSATGLVIAPAGVASGE